MPNLAKVGAKGIGVDLKAWHRPAIRQIDLYITGLGDGDSDLGKTRFLAALLLSTNHDERIDSLLQMVEDPTYAEHSVGHLAVGCGFRAGELLAVVRDMELLVAQARGLKIISDNLAAVVNDVVDRSQRHYISCEQCNETGKVWITPKKEKKRGVTAAEIPDPEPIQVDCLACNGKGKLVAEADVTRQQMVLEIAKLLPKSGGNNIAIQQNLGIAGGGPAAGGGSGGSIGGLFDRIIGATDAILKRGSGYVVEEEEEGGALHTEAGAEDDPPLEGVVISPADEPAAEPEEPHA